MAGKSDDEITTNLSLSASSSEAPDPFVGKTVGKYQILSRIAKGGTATVYKAQDNVLKREVAFKILHEHLEAKSEVVERFRNEAQVVASLRHPNVLNIFDFFVHEGRTVLVAELMPGITLSDLIKKVRKLPEQYVLMLAMEIVNGLRVAHDKGITHRDIKPANILIHSDLGVKISDFGLAKLKDSDTGLTREGVFIGTPSFSSPEQIEGRAIDQRSDLFSLGLTIYMLATGAHAFKQKGDSTTTVWFKIVRGKFQAVRDVDPNISPELERILSKALQVDLDKRYQSAKEMGEDILALLKKRKAFPYADELKKYLENPFPAESAGKTFSRRFQRASIAASLSILVLGSIGFSVWKWNLIDRAKEYLATQKSTSEIPVAESKEPPPTPEVPPSAPTPEPPKPEPTVKPERKPMVSAKPKIEKPEAKVGLSDGLFIPLAPRSTVVFHRDRRDFQLRFPWNTEQEFWLARSTSVQRKLVEGRFKAGGFDWKDWSPGKFVWKAGPQNGEIDILDWEQFRARARTTKRELLISTQFAEADLQINPWTQVLKLSWESGPNASSYRIEIAEDAEFKSVLYSGNSLTKSALIERIWRKDQSLFWRVSYMDTARNVFFIDPVRKLNLKVFLSAPQIDILTPQPYAAATNGKILVEAVAPPDSLIRCADIPDSGSPQWNNLQMSGGIFTAEISLKTDLLLCENSHREEKSFLIIPVQL